MSGPGKRSESPQNAPRSAPGEPEAAGVAEYEVFSRDELVAAVRLAADTGTRKGKLTETGLQPAQPRDVRHRIVYHHARGTTVYSFRGLTNERAAEIVKSIRSNIPKEA